MGFVIFHNYYMHYFPYARVCVRTCSLCNAIMRRFVIVIGELIHVMTSLMHYIKKIKKKRPSSMIQGASLYSRDRLLPHTICASSHFLMRCMLFFCTRLILSSQPVPRTRSSKTHCAILPCTHTIQSGENSAESFLVLSCSIAGVCI